MRHFETLIRRATVIDGSGNARFIGDLGIAGGRIALLGDAAHATATEVVDADGLVLAPGFIDVHTHDDTVVIRQPQMLPKLSQGVTTVIVGNCGISAAPVSLAGEPPDPMNLLGPASAFVYPTFADYCAAVDTAVPAVNVAALVGHTALRSNHMDRLDRSAHPNEIAAMRSQLADALAHGALGLSSGLAYASARSASTAEVMQLAEVLGDYGGLYTTHLRDEFDYILGALDEAFATARHARCALVVSHVKCAGAGNWGRSQEVLTSLETAHQHQEVGCDCYPYSASSSTLDLKQVTGDFDILITWSQPHPDMAGRTLAVIAERWGVPLLDAARRLQPAGAVYHCMSEADVQRILAHPLSMVGSDGLPEDPRPHPRLWGAFPRVLGHYSRDLGLLPLETAVHKMTGLSAARFGLAQRGLLAPGYWADLVLFDPQRIEDTARFDDPEQPAAGIRAVWVNGVLSYRDGLALPRRAGRFLPRNTSIPATTLKENTR
ncbi:N-acyl-D-amino-acid deacylase [Metapseudomonas resinovorans]|uniref:N-acyl-D-amino-acid deacylase family protein n=1 Tax=Metapseudomonas resinovorans TaxID=53412 RepID=UPI003D253E27